jgi:chromosome segregation ATPase
MAEEPIRKEDIIDIAGAQESINELIKTLENLSVVMRKDLKESADVLEKSLQGVNAATKEGQELIKSASASAENLAAQDREMSKIDKEAIQLKARLNALSTDEANEVAKLKVAIEGKNKAMKDAARLDDSAEGSVNKMRAKLKELTAEYNKLGGAARKDVAPAINKLTEELKKAESAIGNNTRNVGNYSEALKGMGTRVLDAVKGFFSFSAMAGIAMMAVNKLKEAFASTTEGMNLLNSVGAVTKQLFYDLATTGQINYKSLQNAAEATALLNKIRAGDREDMVEFAKLEREITKLEFDAADKTKDHAKQQEALNKAIAKQNELSDKRIDDAWEELQAIEQLLSKQPHNEDLLNKQYALKEKIIKLDDQRFSSMRRNESRATQLEQGEVDRRQKQKDLYFKEIEETQKKEAEAAKKRKEDREKEEKEIFGHYAERLKMIQGFWDKNLELEINKGKFKEDFKKLLGVRADKNQLRAAGQNLMDTAAQADNARERESEADQKYNDLKDQRLGESFQRIGDSLNALSGLYESNKQRELSAVGDNAEKREAIERKYAKKQQALAVGQALIGGALAIVEIWEKWSAFPVLAAIFTGLTVAQTAMQVAVIKGQKFAKGGSGILEGNVHASGGINVGIGEAEAGEHVSITSRAMTSKYGSSMLDAVSNSINQGKFFDVWSNANKSMGGDPYTKKMYEMMQNTPTVYTDSWGNTVKEYPNGQKYVIRRFYKN